MVVAEGSAGTWLLFGYLLFLVVGVVAVAVTAIYYQFLEGIQVRVYSGLKSVLAFGHVILWEARVVGSTFLMMYGGYKGGAALFSTSEGGGGLTAYQVHVQILQYYVEPVFIFVLIAVLGAILGGLGYVLSARKRAFGMKEPIRQAYVEQRQQQLHQ